MKIAIVGCGNIAEPYLKDLLNYPNVEVIGVTDVSQERASALAQKYNVAHLPSYEATLATDAELIVNLTTPLSHYEVSQQALNAGKHVFSEKPLALKPEEGWALVDLAKSKGLRLACSPFVSIGEAQQTAWKYIREGRLGKVRVVYGEANWGRIESWHPAPQGFYEVGAWYDVGVYLLTLITTFLAPVRSIWSYTALLKPQRYTKSGEPFTLTTPDWMLSLLQLEDGTQVRISSNFYVSNETSRQKGLEFHGDEGTFALDSFGSFNGGIYYAPFGEKLQPADYLRPPAEGIPWGRGVHRVIEAIDAGQSHPFTGEQAAHIVDVLDAGKRSAEIGQPIAITSTFPNPLAADWPDSH
jgi:predicted dehydrogenase